MSGPVDPRYLDGRYAVSHPDWHATDAPLKADAVLRALTRLPARPRHVVEVGAGPGHVLAALRRRLDAVGWADVALSGWDPSPDAWARRLAGVELHQGDPVDAGTTADVLLVLDVVEHVADDVGFLHRLRAVAPSAVLRIPLDDSLLDRLRPARRLAARDMYGHLHAYTWTRALRVVRDAGWQVDAITPHRVPPPRDTWRRWAVDTTRQAALTRAPRLAAELLGGTSLLLSLTRA